VSSAAESIYMHHLR